MIPEVDRPVLEALRKRLSGLVSEEEVVTGEPDPAKERSVTLVDRDFTVEETGMGSSTSVLLEKHVEKFDADGENKAFTLSKPPVRPLIDVQNPPGTKKGEPDDYTVDFAKATVTFREAPKKEKEAVVIAYNIAKAAGEIRSLRFILGFDVFIMAKDQEERDSITMETIKALYLERAGLEQKGVEELKFESGYSTVLSEDPLIKANVLSYKAEKTVLIEIPMGPMEKIEITRG